MINFRETAEFKKDFKKLFKKYKTLAQDFINLKNKYLTEAPRGNGAKHWSLLHKNSRVEIYKVRMHCDSTRESFFRVVYAYHKETETIELIEFIEIYFKGNKANEDSGRIDDYLDLFNEKH
ncbi:MAG: hypothetical protein ACD_7C00154G0007 [uncultured bacterium]|nr:MAG: hypothetical protein ACD_7C00154G0007 [uncultured bacterium]KKP68205.1 MAG: hypothetical protein UR66_C0007G0012 [Candidatus Moranbacteria bacterium GW2011_GWE1_35_17]KKP82228.1 MAG: hypothetical protein UR83_C0055G0012 [Candidatus Moranbacteria bacterium GW2011_GWF2_35_54]KKP83288.1 MAG: hypothetical protein UR82_C0023G0017 [Candidatus Moranbacteria bacterium GW2011_GWF1_35_5]HBR79360.1 hypothetical protein [Candidatus Moranbacteria bacterium]